MSDILAETPDRFLLLPVRDERAWAFYQEAVACFWTAQELDLTHDRYSELQDSERTLLNNVLGITSQGEPPSAWAPAERVSAADLVFSVVF